MVTEAQARFVLRRMGFRLSQRNGGYTILDADHQIVSGFDADGHPNELTLQQVADWTAAESGGDRRPDESEMPEEQPHREPAQEMASEH
jgi:hypothetical protein